MGLHQLFDASTAKGRAKAVQAPEDLGHGIRLSVSKDLGYRLSITMLGTSLGLLAHTTHDSNMVSDSASSPGHLLEASLANSLLPCAET